MNTQELINVAVNGVLNQKFISKNDKDGCTYRSQDENGNVLKCAVGHIIKDEFYHIGLEGEPISKESADVRLAVEGSIRRALTDEEVDILGTIQWCHDVSDSINDFKEHLKNMDVKWERQK